MGQPLATGNARRGTPERVRLRLEVYEALAARVGADNPTAQADLHGIDRGTVYALKNGTNVPRLDTAMRIAADLETTVEALWERVK